MLQKKKTICFNNHKVNVIEYIIALVLCNPEEFYGVSSL